MALRQIKVYGEDDAGNPVALLVDETGALQMAALGGTVNTELGAAVAAADDLANPTAPQVLAHLMGFDGTTWDRIAVAGTAGAVRVAAGAALSDGASGTTSFPDSAGIARALGAAMMALNGSTNDRWRNNTDATVLASAARTATANGADQVNYNGKGVLVLINVTANPGGGETLSLKAQGKESIGGGYYDLADAGVVLTAANGLKGLLIYPGVVDADLGADIFAKAGIVPRTWRPVVTHSAAGSWTYSVSAVTLL